MFPNLQPSLIESILRKHDGDVSRTIDELLTISNSLSYSSSSGFDSSTECRRNDYEELFPSTSCNVSTTPISNKKVEKTKWVFFGKKVFRFNQVFLLNQSYCFSTVDDEKIALLAQNREFLRYLQRDPNFMREIVASTPQTSNGYSRDNHRNRYTLHQNTQSTPLLIASSRPFSSAHNRCYTISGSGNEEYFPESPRQYYESLHIEKINKKNSKRNIKSEPVPNGPLVNLPQNALTINSDNGPFFDYTNSVKTSWTQKLKSHLPMQKSRNNPTLAFSSNIEGEGEEDGERIENDILMRQMQQHEHNLKNLQNEEHFSSRLKNMSRSETF